MPVLRSPGPVSDIAVGAGADAAPEVRADCSRCFGLCCVALPFARSADFAVDK